MAQFANLGKSPPSDFCQSTRDPNTGVAMFESAYIIAYLRESYEAKGPRTVGERTVSGVKGTEQ